MAKYTFVCRNQKCELFNQEQTRVAASFKLCRECKQEMEQTNVVKKVAPPKTPIQRAAEKTAPVTKSRKAAAPKAPKAPGDKGGANALAGARKAREDQKALVMSKLSLPDDKYIVHKANGSFVVKKDNPGKTIEETTAALAQWREQVLKTFPGAELVEFGAQTEGRLNVVWFKMPGAVVANVPTAKSEPAPAPTLQPA